MKIRRGGERGGEDEEEEEEEEEINVCTLTCTHGDLQYFPILPTFLSHSFFHCPDIAAAVNCVYRTK